MVLNDSAKDTGGNWCQACSVAHIRQAVISTMKATRIHFLCCLVDTGIISYASVMCHTEGTIQLQISRIKILYAPKRCFICTFTMNYVLISPNLHFQMLNKYLFFAVICVCLFLTLFVWVFPRTSSAKTLFLRRIPWSDS